MREKFVIEVAADNIRAFWGKQGYQVSVWIDEEQVSKFGPIRVIKSDLVNGLPKDWKPKDKFQTVLAKADQEAFARAIGDA